MFLLWAVKWSRPPCCTAFFRAQYSAQFSSFYTRSLCLISLNVTLSNITCLLLDPSKSSNLPVVLRIGQSDIPVCYSARNLGVMFDSGLTVKQQVDRICQTTYFEIRRIGSIHQFLTTEATKILATSLVLSRVDYCNFLLVGIPQKLLNKVHRVMNCAARFVCRAPKREHVTPPSCGFALAACRMQNIIQDCYNLLQRDHWHCSFLSVRPPPYHALSAPLLTLASSVFRTDVKRFQAQRAFSFIGPSIWNNLPFSVRHAQTLSAFKSQLKTHIFSISYSD